MSLCVRSLAVALVISFPVLAAADEPAPPPRLLPPGTTIIVPGAPPARIPYRVSQYAVWQNMAPDRFGRFRPVVIYYAPDVAFYSATGIPYPWVNTHPQYFMPYVNE